MSVLLVALDDSAASRPVLHVAQRISPYVGADVVAVHVRENGSGETARAIADAAEVPLLMRSGDVVHELAAAQHELHALAVVTGARRVPAGAKPAGHVAQRLMQDLVTAVVVVPPDAADRELKRVVVAVEGDHESEALVALITNLEDLPGPEVVALHVFDSDHLPAFGDQPVYETEAWASEFLRRAASVPVDSVRLEVRVGDAANMIPSSIIELDADLVVMGWHCNFADGHADVVRHTLEVARVPLLLLPIDRPALLRRRAG